MIERWIWTELLAFDMEQGDYGVSSYLEKVGFEPDGISFLLSAVDFVLLHDGMEHERVLFPDVCSRVGHKRNEERLRQDWTNWKLRGLVEELHKRHVKVFFSIFNYYLYDLFHHEWATDHPEILHAYNNHRPSHGFSLLARLNDGSLFEDVFIDGMRKVVLDYGFDGWHGADCQGPLSSLSICDASDQMFFQFAEFIGKEKFPEEFLHELNNDDTGRARRMSYIWNFLRREWADFNSMRWVSLWRKATEMMHSLGKETMINSPFTRSLFEALFHFGLDYREIDAMKVDYLLVESVATSVTVIDAKYERVFDYGAMLCELRALLPHMKFIMMEPVKDVVENWDAFRHAPARLERDTHLLANQFVQKGGKLRRCADGILYCLGDGITADEWRRLNELTATAFSFSPTKAGELSWLVESESFDRLRQDYDAHGTWPPYFQISHLVQCQGLDISCAADSSELDNLKGPLVVPNFHLLSDSLRGKLLERDGITILLGNFAGIEKVAEGRASVLQRLNAGLLIGCVVVGSKLPPQKRLLKDCDMPQFRCPEEYRAIVEERCPLMEIPEAFWDAAGELVRAAIGESEFERAADGRIHCSMMEDGRRRRVSFHSDKDGYSRAEFRFRSNVKCLEKLCAFPYNDFIIQEGRLIMDNYGHTPVVVPPRGIVTIEFEES